MPTCKQTYMVDHLSKTMSHSPSVTWVTNCCIHKHITRVCVSCGYYCRLDSAQESVFTVFIWGRVGCLFCIWAAVLKLMVCTIRCAGTVAVSELLPCRLGNIFLWREREYKEKTISCWEILRFSKIQFNMVDLIELTDVRCPAYFSHLFVFSVL